MSLADLPVELLAHIALFTDHETITQLCKVSGSFRDALDVPATYQSLIKRSIARDGDFYNGRTWSAHHLLACAQDDVRKWECLAAASDLGQLIHRIRFGRLYAKHIESYIGELAVLQRRDVLMALRRLTSTDPIIDHLPWYSIENYLYGDPYREFEEMASRHDPIYLSRCPDSLVLALLMSRLRAIEHWRISSTQERDAFYKLLESSEWRPHFVRMQPFPVIVYDILAAVVKPVRFGPRSSELPPLPRMENLFLDPMDAPSKPHMLLLPHLSNRLDVVRGQQGWVRWHAAQTKAMVQTSQLFNNEWLGYICYDKDVASGSRDPDMATGYRQSVQFVPRDALQECDTYFQGRRRQPTPLQQRTNTCPIAEPIRFSVSYAQANGRVNTRPGILEVPLDMRQGARLLVRWALTDAFWEWHCYMTAFGVVGVTKLQKERECNHQHSGNGYIWLWRKSD